jgi:hypothetical protein
MAHDDMNAREEVLPCGWFGSVRKFLEVEKQDWLDAQVSHHLRCMLSEPSSSQMSAWRNCFDALRKSLGRVVGNKPEALDWSMVFEYELPRERGRRPDLVIITGTRILVLEFKDFGKVQAAHVDQASAYARDLIHYHEATRDRPVNAYLVLTQISGFSDLTGSVRAISPDCLGDDLTGLQEAVGDKIDSEAWIRSDYSPLPSLVSAARTIFAKEPLPQIRRAHSAGIPQALKSVTDASIQAAQHHEMHLVLITGVPGAGKTLVGLQFVYQTIFGESASNRPALFLSGNGPLVKVLQHALASNVFVQDVHGFLRQYGGASKRVPEEHIWVYDEAQRAWDADRVREKRGHGLSEPEDFLSLGERISDWAVVVGLIGEGQEIHLGEESGLRQWNEALGRMEHSWHVHCPTHIAPIFKAAGTLRVDDSLNLDASLRTHVAEDVQLWVALLLRGELTGAAEAAAKVQRQGFKLYLSRKLGQAADYVSTRYAEASDKRYGLLASSKAKNLEGHGINNSYAFTKNLREGPWYNDPPESPNSCRQLREVATEFACQGLELDFPIVAWGDDLKWSVQSWQSRPSPRSTARDPHQLRINSYRVLLSRGRDGIIVYVPPTREMDSTFQALSAAGMVDLGS